MTIQIQHKTVTKHQHNSIKHYNRLVFMRKLFICLLTLLASQAYALDVSYSHVYEDYSKKHSDQFGLSHTFSNGITAVAEMKALPQKNQDGSAGNAFSHDEMSEKRYKLKYKYNLTPQIELTPEIEWDDKEDSEKYKARLATSFKFNNTQKIFAKYRYEVVKYTDKNKLGRRVSLIETGFTQTFNRFKITPAYGFYHATSAIYNNKNSDYKYQITVDYQANKKISPYIEIRNESFTSTLKQRQTVFETGVQYKFF